MRKADAGKPRPKQPGSNEVLPVLRRAVAGIDLGAKAMHVAGPPLPDGSAQLAQFGTATGQILECVKWLRDREVESVAMERTGVYWIPVLEILESEGFEVLLVDSRPLSRVPGRKTDMIDCQWIQMLHSCGLLKGCYRPAPEITELRTLARSKGVLVKEQSDWLRRMQKVMDEMNVRVHHAVSDVQGTTGMAIIRAIAGGERDPQKLAAMRDPRCRHSERQIAEFLTGNWRADHVFNLQQCLKMYDSLEERLKEYEQEIQRRMKALTPPGRENQQAPPLPNRERMKALKRRRQEDKRNELYRLLGADLTSIDGIGVETAEVIISEYGPDLSKFATEGEFVKHVGLAPRQNITGGKPVRKRGKGVQKTTRTAQALRNAATALKRSRTALGALYRRMSRTKDAGTAVFVTARKLATLVYRMLRWGQQYVDEGQQAYEARFEAARLRGITETARQMGYTLIKKAAVSA
jgi:transposase